ncbi:MAG: radical SAM protein [Acidobacteriota bacterium]|nr:radical SAM protein [Acidobacteriota bacterium]
MRMTLSLTHRCNLACRYCYAGRKFKRDMSPETARAAIDLAWRNTRPGDVIDMGFFGGEPLLCLDLMETCTDYIDFKQHNDTPHPVSLKATTNGTLLDEGIVDFLKQKKVNLCVSIDGTREIHDVNRVFPNGKGSFALVIANLREYLERLEGVQVNAVYGPDSLSSLPRTLALFEEIDAYAVHFNADINASWTAEAVTLYDPVFQELAERYIASFERGREMALNLIDSKIVLFMKGGYEPCDRCQMGDNELAVAPSGNIYACERFISDDGASPFCLGNVHTGLDTRKRCRIRAGRGNRNPECGKCPVNAYCMNWCGCTNYHMTGKADLAHAALCAGERANLKWAKHVLATLIGRDNQLFLNHFKSYLETGGSFSV